MDGQPLGEVGNRRLCARIGRDLGQRRERVHGGYVENAAARPAQHLPGERLGGDQGAEEIEVEDKFHPGGVQIKKAFGIGVQIPRLVIFLVHGGAGIVPARAVDQQVARPQLPFHGGGRFAADRLIQHVAGIGARRASFGVDFVRPFPGRLQVSVQQGDSGPRAGQHPGKSGTEHAARSGDHSDLPAKVGAQHILFHSDYLLAVKTRHYLFQPFRPAFSHASNSPLIYAAPSARSYSP